MNAPVLAQQKNFTAANEYTALRFLISQVLNGMVAAAVVEVISCSNAGDVSPQGTVTVQPLVNQLSGNGQAVPHLPLYNVPYARQVGGANAVIMDPEKGDIGLVVFASRDISKVKATLAQANPGSARIFDWADGMYVVSILAKGAPNQYVQVLTNGGINVVSPTQITLQAPNISLLATSGIAMQSPANDISGGGTSIDGKPFLPHEHSGVTTGGDPTGPVA
jgi:hypothetical protein